MSWAPTWQRSGKSFAPPECSAPRGPAITAPMSHIHGVPIAGTPAAKFPPIRTRKMSHSYLYQLTHYTRDTECIQKYWVCPYPDSPRIIESSRKVRFLLQGTVCLLPGPCQLVRIVSTTMRVQVNPRVYRDILRPKDMIAAGLQFRRPPNAPPAARRLPGGLPTQHRLPRVLPRVLESVANHEPR